MSDAERRPVVRVLYLVYWGALEPLGRSLVVPAVLRLAELGIDLTVLTFEKPADLADHRETEALRSRFMAAGVCWRPLRYHKAPKWPATAFDSLAALLTALRLRASGRFDVVHARTFVSGPVGYVISKLIGARFVYHNEGFYPDEQVDGGVWVKGSFVHRLARRVEAFIYDHADAVITLSQRARAIIKARPAIESAETPVIVVPSAVDLDRFRPGVDPPQRLQGPSLVYLGSVGLRYRLDDAGKFVNALRGWAPGTTLTVVSRAERALVEEMLDSSGLPREAWRLKALPHSAVPAELAQHDAGLLFWPQGLSEHGCSPTKVGEYWACGLPVVTTPNISDTDTIVRERGVGVVVDPARPGSFAEGAHQLLALLEDVTLRQRCRKAAEATYSLEDACIRQVELCRALVRLPRDGVSRGG